MDKSDDLASSSANKSPERISRRSVSFSHNENSAEKDVKVSRKSSTYPSTYLKVKETPSCSAEHSENIHADTSFNEKTSTKSNAIEANGENARDEIKNTSIADIQEKDSSEISKKRSRKRKGEEATNGGEEVQVRQKRKWVRRQKFDKDDEKFIKKARLSCAKLENFSIPLVPVRADICGMEGSGVRYTREYQALKSLQFQIGFQQRMLMRNINLNSKALEKLKKQPLEVLKKFENKELKVEITKISLEKVPIDWNKILFSHKTEPFDKKNLIKIFEKYVDEGNTKLIRARLNKPKWSSFEKALCIQLVKKYNEMEALQKYLLISDMLLTKTVKQVRAFVETGKEVANSDCDGLPEVHCSFDNNNTSDNTSKSQNEEIQILVSSEKMDSEAVVPEIKLEPTEHWNKIEKDVFKWFMTEGVGICLEKRIKLIADELPTKSYQQVEKFTKSFLQKQENRTDSFEKENDKQAQGKTLEKISPTLVINNSQEKEKKSFLNTHEISILKEGKDIYQPALHRYEDLKTQNEAKEFHLKIMDVIKSTKNCSRCHLRLISSVYMCVTCFQSCNTQLLMCPRCFGYTSLEKINKTLFESVANYKNHKKWHKWMQERKSCL